MLPWLSLRQGKTPHPQISPLPGSVLSPLRIQLYLCGPIKTQHFLTFINLTRSIFSNCIPSCLCPLPLLSCSNSSCEHTDIDECENSSSSLCDHECVNTVGSFQCRCRSGYILTPNQRSCIPVHNCKFLLHCQKNARLRQKMAPAANIIITAQ